jgi:hypothetical protein
MMDTKVASYIDAVVGTFAFGQQEIRRVFDAMQKHCEVGYDVQASQLLALRRYLRVGGAALVAQFPWTVLQQRTVYETLIADVKAAAKEVKAKFEAANPGLELRYTGARDLNRQAYLWTHNQSVLVASLGLMRDAKVELMQACYHGAPTTQSAEQFGKFLKKRRVIPEPTNAAPGLSDHGQMRAVDFYIQKDGKTVASIRKQTIAKEWGSTGFEAKLKAATLGTRLEGPLQTPYEPWHYGIR